MRPASICTHLQRSLRSLKLKGYVPQSQRRILASQDVLRSGRQRGFPHSEEGRGFADPGTPLAWIRGRPVVECARPSPLFYLVHEQPHWYVAHHFCQTSEMVGMRMS